MTEGTMVVRGKRVRFVDEEDARARVDRADQIPEFPDEEAERAWWSEHTFSEEFWRNAEPVPDSDLPPVRRREPQPNATAPAAISSAFGAGMIAGAALVIAAYLVYRLLRAGVSTADFLPTVAPHLRISA